MKFIPNMDFLATEEHLPENLLFSFCPSDQKNNLFHKQFIKRNTENLWKSFQEN